MIKIKNCWLVISILLIIFLIYKINSKQNLLLYDYLLYFKDNGVSNFSYYSADEIKQYKIVCHSSDKILLFVESKDEESFYFPIHKKSNVYYLEIPKEGQSVYNEKYCD